ncbi:MAG TPA: hypothetical protein VF596_13005 [Pyrinomonadaceae bacterium]
MAQILSIRGYSKSTGKEILYLEPFWWKHQQFSDHSLVKEIIEEGFYDFEATLSPQHLREMHELFLINLDNDLYKTDHWRKLVRERVAALDWATGEGANEFSHFIAGSYEWDSGM